MDKARITPAEFQGTIKRLSKATYRTPYVPGKLKRALRESGAGQFAWRSASQRQFLKTVRDLQAEGLVKTKKELTPKRLYRNILEERTASEDVPSDVPLGAGKLPGRLAARKFIEYYGQATGKSGDLKTALQSLGLPTGALNPRTGAEPHLVKRQMLLALEKLREAGKLTRPNIGAAIAHAHRRTQVFVQEGISQELAEQERRRYVAAAHEELPEGIRRAIGRPAADSALRTGSPQERSSSVGRASRQGEAGAAAEGHATTASALARRPKPYDPKTSAARKGKSPSPGAAPELADLPFDLE